jgi:nitric oxide reductase subunit B
VEARPAHHHAVRLHRDAGRRLLHVQDKAPIPEAVVSARGEVLFTAADIQAGQELFRKRDLMNYGSILGHGAYLGPDYTAEALHWMSKRCRRRSPAERYARCPPANRPPSMPRSPRNCASTAMTTATGRLLFTTARRGRGTTSCESLREHFARANPLALPKGALLPAAEGGGDPARHAEATRQFAAFVTWTAWLSVAKRPEANHSYTNNWPYDKARPANGPPPAR